MPRRNGNAERSSEKRWRTRTERKRKGNVKEHFKTVKKEKQGK